MAYTPPNPNGQATSANSAPVVLASDQSTVRTKLANDVASTTGTITTATSSVTSNTLTGVGSVTISVYGTYAGVNLTFEGYDGVNWYGIPAYQASGTATPSSILTTGAMTNQNNIYNITNVLGLQQIRVRATAWTSGTATVIIRPSAQFLPFSTSTAVTTMPTTAVSQSGTWGFVPGMLATSANPATLYYNAALSNTAVQIKSGAGRPVDWNVYNPNTTAVWLLIYNALSANVTVGTTTPTKAIFIPANTVWDRANVVPGNYGTGITIAASTSNTASVAPTTGLVVNLEYA